jgi:hypothetical protein
MATTVKAFLEHHTLTRAVVDRYLDPDGNNWACFDSELGYLLRSNLSRDGLGWCYTTSTYAPGGARKMIHYADRPCRINTYGDSFVQCDQVSDGETWQEVLAAHLGEPIRNFGIGSYGVYQSYRRMLREEDKTPADYVILNAYDEDHQRNVYQWRGIHMSPHFWPSVRDATESEETFGFHANPWCFLRMNLDSGNFDEIENSHPTPESLYELCDAAYVYETFKDNIEIQAFMAAQGAEDVDWSRLQALADVLEFSIQTDTPDARARTAAALLLEYGQRATIHTFNLARVFLQSMGKKLMIHLPYSMTQLREVFGGAARNDECVIDYLKANRIVFVDCMEQHLEDYKSFSCDVEDYLKRYYVGHYSPAGNHFCAYQMKDTVVDWLEPKPPAYRHKDPQPDSPSTIRDQARE